MPRKMFYIRKSDRQVILTLLLIGAVVLCVLIVPGGSDDNTGIVVPADSIARAAAAHNADSVSGPYYQQEERRVERFAFDPNTADSTQLLRLGLRFWQVRNIYRYRAAGGIYRSKEDFARLYGLTVKEYRELEPYIRISADYLPASTLFSDSGRGAVRERDTLQYPVKLGEGETVDLATADTSLLKRVPGIGSYFARRIIEYRQRLGGYASLDQLNEIADFPQDAKAYLTLDAPVIQKININTQTLNELRRHPYINYYQARAITDYRRQYGAISDLEELRLLPDFTTEVIERLRPYVEY